MKICNGCWIEKPIENFYTVKSKRNQRGIYHLCKECCAAQRLTMKDYYRDWELKKKYGISLETYKKESELRGNCCDICDKEVPSLHVDHCHQTKKIRGYLCGSCNRGIGLLQDSSQITYNAAVYLKTHGS